MFHGNGALVANNGNGRVSRQVAMLNRIAFTGDADIRAREQMDKDELEQAKLAALAGNAKRAVEKYQAGLTAVAELLRRMDGEEMTAAEAAITQAMVMEHQKAMASAIAEFCGNAVDAEKIVANDLEKLRQSMQGSSRRRNGKVAKAHNDFSVQED